MISLLLLCLVPLFLYLCYQNYSFPHEPPVVFSWIPYIGSGIQFSQNCAAFLAKQRARFADIFTLILGGQRFHVILDETAWDTLFYNKREELSFIQFEKQAMENAFGFRPQVSYLPEVTDEAHNIYIKHLMGSGLDKLSESINTHLLNWFKQDQNKHGVGVPVRTNLFEILFRCGFEAGVRTFFGASCLQGNDHMIQLFRSFDSKFALLFGNAPKFLVKDALQARTDLAQYMSQAYFDGTQSDAIKAFQEIFETHPLYTQADAGRSLVAFMWTSHSNTLPALFWFIYYVFRDPHVLNLIRQEIQTVLDKYDIKHTLMIPRAAFKEMPILDSCWQEVLRLRTGSLTMRGATQTCEISLPSGKSLHVRRGDSIALFPYLHHHDPEIFENPEEFQYDRFLIKDGKAPVFYKDGVKLKHSLVAFGGGVSMCPGRFFIANEIKMLAVLMCTLMEFELDPNHKTPVGNPTRCGLGIIPPLEDVPITYRYRGSI